MLPSFSTAIHAACRSGPPLLLLLLTLLAVSAHAQEATGPPDKPILRIETGVHGSTVYNISLDAQQRYLVSASYDKTVRVWDAATGDLLSILRLPIPAACGGPYPVDSGDAGKIYAVSITPNGRQVACGGWTGGTPEGGYCLYIFDRVSGQITQRLTGLPWHVYKLACSPDGRYLAAGTGPGGGLRLYRTSDYALVGEDKNYADKLFGLDFAAVSGDADALRLAACSDDGTVRLYAVRARDSSALELLQKHPIPGGKPYSVAFSPDHKRLAVGSSGSMHIQVFTCGAAMTGFTAVREAPSRPGDSTADVNDMRSVCWSSDGRTLYAGGRYQKKYGNIWRNIIRRWDDFGQASPVDTPVAADTLFGFQPRRAGGVFWGDGAATVGALDGVGAFAWNGKRVAADLSYTVPWRISQDGQGIVFGYGSEDVDTPGTQFSIAGRSLKDAQADNGLTAPITDSGLIPVKDWRLAKTPSLNGTLLPLLKGDFSNVMAVVPDGHSFLLGTGWYLHHFDAVGKPLWSVSAPADTYQVNASGDSKLATAGFADGTIRWYRMTDGQELLAFFPHADRKRWVLWTPSGYYDCSPGAEDLIGWHVNRGRDQAADFFPASRFRDTYYRPDVVSKILTTQDEAEALSQANAEAGRKAQTAGIQKTLPPVVAITAPDDGASAATDHLVLSYLLRTPSGEPVTEVRALVDGRPVQTESGLAVVSAAGIARILSVPLPPRDCSVSVLTFNKFGASEPASVHVHWAGTAKGTVAVSAAGPEFTIQPTLYVLAVGIGKYDDPTLHLTYPAKDAQDFLAAMRAQRGRLYKNVTVYKDKALTDGDATKESIEDGLDWLQKQATSNDVAMIFLSGHGSNDANGKYFFLPVGFSRDRIKSTGLPFTDIVSTVQDIAGKVILFNDSCHSGNVLGGGLKGLPDSTGAINELISAENGAVCFAASTGSEFAREDPVWGNGAFTKALVEGVSGSADYGHTGRITVNMLSLYVAERVKALTGGSQHPTANKPPTVRDFPLALDGQK